MPDLNSCSLANYQSFFHQQTHRNAKNILRQFKKVISSFVFFKVCFFILFFVELFLFGLFLFKFNNSFFLAIILAAIFLTSFSYFVLLFYFQAKKPDQLTALKNQFVHYCKEAISLPQGTAEHHLSIVQATLRLVSHLHDFEYRFFHPPKFLKLLASVLEKLNFRFCGEDVFKMKELLLFAAVDEHLEQIRNSPTDLEVHASLANTYVVLSRLYMYPRKGEYTYISGLSKKTRSSLHRKFKLSSKRAIEEFKILNDYAPNNSWVHAQLAQSYHNLEMPEKEAEEYETILQLSPCDNEILFRLGVLYFEMGKNAKALRIYEQLKKVSYKKADDLIVFYDASRSSDFNIESTE